VSEPTIATTLDVTVYGDPAPQGSKRYVGNGVSIESSKKVRPWRQDVKGALEDALPAGHQPWDGPIMATIVFYFPRPKSHYRTGRNAHLLRDAAPATPANSRNDIDKLTRAVLDAATAAGVFADDGLVVDLHAAKAYTDGRPGAHIRIRPVDLAGEGAA
jgi:Holliday junction resolvase RusA-like endonuclease